MEPNAAPESAENEVTASSDEAATGSDELVEHELLVEEISIDGMCGVY